MPANREEVEEALAEGVDIQYLTSPTRIWPDNGHLSMECIRMKLGEVDASGRKHPEPVAGTEFTGEYDTVVMALGLQPDTSIFTGEIELNKNGTIKADGTTLQTSVPYVFAGGDAVTGSSTITATIGQGKRAAFYIDRYLQGQSLETVTFDERLPLVDRDRLVAQARDSVSVRKPLPLSKGKVSERITSFAEYVSTMSEDDAVYSANRCLDCGNCSECRQCVLTCPADAVLLDMVSQHESVAVGSVAVATGLDIFDAAEKPALGYKRLPNVIDAVQMDRILSPTRPYNAVLRPSDGKAPCNIAFVLCVGSRDRTVNNRLCSRVCCMYSLKQAQLLMGALPLADVTIYYIDIRAFGKGYEEFYQQARAMGIYFVKGKVARIEETDNQDLLVHYEDIEGEGGTKQASHDLVVLSVGMIPAAGSGDLFKNGDLQMDEFSYIKEVNEDIEPGKTSIDGVFGIGSATAVRDIPDTILHSGAAAAQIAAYLKKKG
jgi:heterodisulfide reductase subunit A